MKKLIAFPIFVFILLLVSCDKNNDLDNLSTTKIPIDSIFFRVRLTINRSNLNPLAQSGFWESTTTRLMKVQNSTKDSILVSYTQAFSNARYRVEIGFSETILLPIDTTSLWLTVPNQKVSY